MQGFEERIPSRLHKSVGTDCQKPWLPRENIGLAEILPVARSSSFCVFLFFPLNRKRAF